MRYATLTNKTPWIIADDALARGPGSRYLVAGWPGFDAITQAIQYLDASNQTPLAWANRLTTFSIVAEYEFADESSCFLFNCRLAQTVPLSGRLDMGVRGAGGAQFSWNNAVVQRVVPIMGATDGQVVSTRLRYDIIAGSPITQLF